MGISKASPLTNTALLLQVTLSWGNSLQAWVDSGAARNFMDDSLEKKLSFPSESLSFSLAVMALDR